MSTLAPTPPLGWNSWNTFGDKVDETVVRETADAIVRSGMRDAGYEYVVIDDCWSDKKGRDSNGDLVPDLERFPNGIKALADHVHSLGLKFGIYSDAANLTCAGWPGSYLNEEQDAALWASWGVDFLKYDYCHAPKEQEVAIERYTRMGDALKTCGREILFSLCEWGERAPYLWGRKTGGQMWRVTGDVVDGWSNLDVSINDAIELGAYISEYAGPGGWNDMDMLVVGIHGEGHTSKQGCSDEEYRTQMAMWSILCSPLMAGCDIRTMDAASADTMMNPEILAVNQDPLGKQAVRVAQKAGLEVWKKPLADGSIAVALLNRTDADADIQLRWRDLSLFDDKRRLVRDLWARQDVAEATQRIEMPVPAHGTAMLQLCS